MQQNTVYLNLSTDEQQELIALCLQYLALTRPVLQPAVNVAGRPA